MCCLWRPSVCPPWGAGRPNISEIWQIPQQILGQTMQIQNWNTNTITQIWNQMYLRSGKYLNKKLDKQIQNWNANKITPKKIIWDISVQSMINVIYDVWLFSAPPDCESGKFSCGAYKWNSTYCIPPNYRCSTYHSLYIPTIGAPYIIMVTKSRWWWYWMNNSKSTNVC